MTRLTPLAIALCVAFASMGAHAQAATAVADTSTSTSSLDTLGNSAVRAKLAELRLKPHDYLPLSIKSDEIPYRYALLDNTSFQPNVFTSRIPGVNDKATPTAGGPGTTGLVRMAIQRKPGLPTNPDDPRTQVSVYLDVAGLKSIKAEGGNYELQLWYDSHVPPVGPARPDGTASFGTITSEDARILAAMGTGNNVPGNVFTLDGKAPRYPSPDDVWPGKISNVVPFPINAGAFNTLRQDDGHHHWEFKPATNMVFPHFEFPHVGGQIAFMPPAGAFAAGVLGQFLSSIPGSGPAGIQNDGRTYGDNPDIPRDPDRSEASVPEQLEFRLRSSPSGMNEEIHADVFLRRASFMPGVSDPQTRLYASVARQVALIDKNGDGVLSFQEIDMNGTSDGGLPNTRLYFPISVYSRFTITREANDGLVAPRFANTQRAVVLQGFIKDASAPRQ